jgi:hypothetical protein
METGSRSSGSILSDGCLIWVKWVNECLKVVGKTARAVLRRPRSGYLNRYPYLGLRHLESDIVTTMFNDLFEDFFAKPLVVSRTLLSDFRREQALFACRRARLLSFAEV